MPNVGHRSFRKVMEKVMESHGILIGQKCTSPVKVIINLYVIPRLPAWNKNALKKKEILNVRSKNRSEHKERRQKPQCVQARERSAAEKDKYLPQQREVQDQIEAARRKQQEQEETINTLREKLRRM